MPDQAEYLRRVADIADVVRHDAPEADRHRRLGDKTVAALCDTGLLRMVVPEQYGGGGLHLGETFAVVEAMARVDGSTGWNLNIGATSIGIAVALKDDAARDQVLGDPSSIVAGTLTFLNIKATRVDGGYSFDGRATYMSGSAHASWISLGGWLHENGEPVVNNGGPVIVSGVLPAAALVILDTWRVSGMRATASNDAVLDGVFIPDRFIAGGAGSGLVPGDPAESLPLLSRFGGGLASVGLGAARGALDALIALAGDKVPYGSRSPLRERVDVQTATARAFGLLEAGRAVLRQRWEATEAKVLAGGAVDVDDQAMLRLSFVTAAELAAEAVDLVCDVAGMSGLLESEPIERCWRDVHAVTKHVAVSHRFYERLGQIFLGMPAGKGPI